VKQSIRLLPGWEILLHCIKYQFPPPTAFFFIVFIFLFFLIFILFLPIFLPIHLPFLILHRFFLRPALPTPLPLFTFFLFYYLFYLPLHLILVSIFLFFFTHNFFYSSTFLLWQCLLRSLFYTSCDCFSIFCIFILMLNFPHLHTPRFFAFQCPSYHSDKHILTSFI
jgi:hypothetical protein